MQIVPLRTPIGFCKCPVCGDEMPVKINKASTLYSICKNNHRINFRRDESEYYIPRILGGDNVTIGSLFINTLTKKGKIEDDTRTTNNNEQRTNDDGRGHVDNTDDRGNTISGVGNAHGDSIDNDDDWYI